MISVGDLKKETHLERIIKKIGFDDSEDVVGLGQLHLERIIKKIGHPDPTVVKLLKGLLTLVAIKEVFITMTHTKSMRQIHEDTQQIRADTQKKMDTILNLLSRN